MPGASGPARRARRAGPRRVAVREVADDADEWVPEEDEAVLAIKFDSDPPGRPSVELLQASVQRDLCRAGNWNAIGSTTSEALVKSRAAIEREPGDTDR